MLNMKYSIFPLNYVRNLSETENRLLNNSHKTIFCHVMFGKNLLNKQNQDCSIICKGNCIFKELSFC